MVWARTSAAAKRTMKIILPPSLAPSASVLLNQVEDKVVALLSPVAGCFSRVHGQVIYAASLLPRATWSERISVRGSPLDWDPTSCALHVMLKNGTATRVVALDVLVWSGNDI